GSTGVVWGPWTTPSRVGEMGQHSDRECLVMYLSNRENSSTFFFTAIFLGEPYNELPQKRDARTRVSAPPEPSRQETLRMSTKAPSAGCGRPCRAALAALLILTSSASAVEPWSALINPDNSLSFSFLRDEQPVFHVGLSGWGPKWAWVGVQARDKADGKKLS